MSRYHDGQKGYALVTTMFMLVALTVLGLASIQMSALEIDIPGNVRCQDQAYMAAKGGVQYLKYGAVDQIGQRISLTSLDSSGLGLPVDISFRSGHYDGVYPRASGKSGTMDISNLVGSNRTNRLQGGSWGGGFGSVIVGYSCNSVAREEQELGFSYTVVR